MKSVGICCLVLSLVFYTQAFAEPASSTPPVMISNYRVQHGEGRVTVDPALNRIAQEQANAMASKQTLDHSVLAPFSSRVASSDSDRAAENIAYGYDDFAKTLDQWIGSDGHRKNLLLHGASRVGVASSKSSTGRTFDLRSRARTGLYRRPEGVRMFRKQRREKILREHEARQTQERFERNERAGKEIYARMAELKNVPRENLPDAVFMLSMAAKHQGEQIRQSIKDRTRYDFDFDTFADGDLATYLAEDAGHAFRDHVTNPQTFFEALFEQLPDVHFTIQQQDAVSMMAAMIREQRLEGILEGLRLAGLLNEAPKPDGVG